MDSPTHREPVPAAVELAESEPNRVAQPLGEPEPVTNPHGIPNGLPDAIPVTYVPAEQLRR